MLIFCGTGPVRARRLLALLALSSACGGRSQFIDGELVGPSVAGAGGAFGASGTGGAGAPAAAGGSLSSSFGGASSSGATSGGAGDSGAFAGSGGAGAASGGATGPSPFTPPAADADAADEATNLAFDAAHDNRQENATIASPLKLRWSVTLEDYPQEILAAHQRVYVVVAPDRTELRAFSIDSGAPLWGPVALGSGSYGVAYDLERLFSIDLNGKLSAFDASTGAPIWTTALVQQSQFTSAPVASGGLVYVNGEGEGGTTFAVDGSSGKVVWMVNTSDGSDGSVAVLGSRVYEAETCTQVSAFEVATGVRDWYHPGNCAGGGGATPSAYGNWIWSFESAGESVILDTAGYAHGSFSADKPPTFDQGTVFYQFVDTLTAVDIATLTKRWNFSLGLGGDCFGPVVAAGNHRVFVATADTKLYELDATTGATVSSDTLGTPDDPFGCAVPLTIAEDRLLMGFGYKLLAY